jgi:hypothetical protein
MGAVEIIKLVLALLPLVVEAVKEIEKLFPHSGMGPVKKAMALQMIEKADPASYKQTAVALDNIVDKTVSILNASGEFKK